MYEHLNNQYILSADIGGSHILAALVDASSKVLLDASFQRVSIQQNADAVVCLEHPRQFVRYFHHF